ncbi:hypothetical protein PPTG_24111 [Phytophthora nicotianae INRA-310]|uniref:RxLR effector protein n=2 Tax=Phytophthora nicotianae TaxID=4792 RepID=W2PM93_PHYN3|nr:hypothetical protein PPTG_24111 [Phytophthora nicotianae INRA-310]ETN01150.1 hypothetical protein PPTG_24111 [Phytophthora nicotianae INRA-310]KUF90170.1 hypothetical protein AM587_10007776 [Phytophthora nicotianae]
MSVKWLVLAIAAAIILTASNVASITTSSTTSKKSTLDFPSLPRVSSRYHALKGRSLRSGASGDDVKTDEDRAFNTFATADDAGRNFLNAANSNPILKKLDNFMLKLRYKWWLMRGKTPENIRVKLGLHFVTNDKTHPNYKKWLGYLYAFNKKHKISG